MISSVIQTSRVSFSVALEVDYKLLRKSDVGHGIYTQLTGQKEC